MASKNWKRLKRASAVVALGVTGCGLSESVKPQPPVEASAAAPKPQQGHAVPVGGDHAAVDASIQQSLDRLQALNLFSVNKLVLNLPANATDCYGVPCPGDTASLDAWNAEKARQAPRLAKLADQAESCNSGNCYVFTPSSTAAAVEALNALQIVVVGGMIEVQPANNPSCYNLPCQSDRDAAAAENQRRAVETYTIVEYSQDL